MTSIPALGSRLATCLAATLLLSACAIAELKTSIKDTETRIDTKQQTLTAEQRAQAALAAQRNSLLDDLRNREMTVAQLAARLDSLLQTNAQIQATTPAEIKRRDDRTRTLADASRRARAIDRDNSVTPKDKAKRAEALKDETRRALEVLLIG